MHRRRLPVAAGLLAPVLCPDAFRADLRVSQRFGSRLAPAEDFLHDDTVETLALRRPHRGVGRTAIPMPHSALNLADKHAKARIEIDAAVTSARRSDVLERPGDELPLVNGAYDLELRPHEIATVLFTIAP